MLHFLITNAYPVMVPLSLVEGPIIALAGGAGAAAGLLNAWWVYAIVMGGALFQDTVYYGLGLKAAKSKKIHALARHARLVGETLGSLDDAWRDEMFLTLVVSKFAYGLYAPVIVSAGMAKAPFWRFLGESLALSALVLAAWLGAGYAIARAFGSVGPQASWAMAALGLLAPIGLVFVARGARRRLGRGRRKG